MKFSVIIPAFNLENYISRCLDSVLKQDLAYNEYEILVINDGSTDQTKEKVSLYTERNSNIFLFNKTNGGVSSARNMGIENAKGEYILFVDGDDWLVENVLSTMYSKLKADALEVASFSYKKIYNNIELNKEVALKESTEVTSGLDFIIQSATNDFYPWLYSISNSFLKKHELLFNTSISFCEDKEFLIRTLSLTQRFKGFELVYYNYYIGRDQAVSTTFKNKHVTDLVNANFLIYSFAEDKVANTTHKEFIKKSALNAILNSSYTLTTMSVWSRFWFWAKTIQTNPVFNNIQLIQNNKLSMLKSMSVIFYLVHYFPRAVYHKLNFLTSNLKK